MRPNQDCDPDHFTRPGDVWGFRRFLKQSFMHRFLAYWDPECVYWLGAALQRTCNLLAVTTGVSTLVSMLPVPGLNLLKIDG